MVEITNASTLMPTSITVVEDGTTISVTTTPLDVTVATGAVTIQRQGIETVNGDAGPVVVLDTGDITEGVNLYYTTARANTDFDSRLATKSTTDLAEGVNLYYTDARVQSVINTNSAGFITASSADTLTNKSGNISQWTNDVGYLTSETDSQTLSFVNPNLSISNGNTVDLSALTPTSLDWTAITNTPTTISGYGITDAYTTTNFNTDFATKTTTDLTEGTNLYYTDARADARIALQTGANLYLGSKTTDDLNEGSLNLYYTLSRATTAARNAINVQGSLNYNNTTGVISYTTPPIPSDVSDLTDTTGLLERDDLSNNTTTDLAEGTNLYYTDARADARVNLQTGANLDLSQKTTTDLAEGTNLYYTDARVSLRLSTESINRLADVNTVTVTPTSGDALVWNGSTWSPSAVATGDPTKVVAAVKNVTTGTLAKGTPVHITGATGNTFHVIAARADTPGAMPAAGILAQQLTANSDGNMIIQGFINGVDTSTFSAGDEIYVAATGGYDNAPPAGESNLIQKLGVVSVVDATNGSGLIQGAGRTNATPNLDNDQFFLGNASNQAEAVDFTAAVEAISINNVVEDLSPQLGSSLDVNDFSILNNGSNPYFYLGDTGNLIPATHALGAWRSKSITGFTGATRAFFNGDMSKATLGGNVSVSNGRIVNNYSATTLDLNSYSLTSTGITRGLHTWLAQSPTIQNTGAASVSLAQNRNVMVQGMFLEGSNITVDESSSVYINQFYEGDDGTGTITNAYGLYINDAGTSGATVTNKYSIYSNGANNPMYHAGTVTIGAFTLPNTDGSAGQVLTTDGFGNVTWTTVSGGGAYGDADVDLHLNTSTAATGEVLSWNGVDYDWVAQGGGGGSFTGDLLGATLQDSTNSSIAMSDVIHISSDATHNTKPAAIRISENEYIDGPSILIQKANGFDIDAGYLQVQKRTQAVTGSYPRLVHVFDALDVAPGSTTNFDQTMSQQMRRVYYNSHYNAWENLTQTIYEFGLDGSFNVNTDTNSPGVGKVGTSNQKMNWGVPLDFQMNGTAGFANSTGSTAVFSILTGANAITNSVNIEIRTDATGPTQFNAIDDQAWLNTGVGVYDSRIDPWWSYGTNWLMTMRFTMPSWATQTSVTVDKAFPPFGQIVSQWGFIYPSYANTPTWANTNTRQITMTRPGSGRNLYEYKFECINGSLFVRDWRLDNIA